jgi:hypothetical protein
MAAAFALPAERRLLGNLVCRPAFLYYSVDGASIRMSRIFTATE